MSNSKSAKVLLPLIIAVSICIGIVVGNFFATRSFKIPVSTKGSFNKINALLEIIDRHYVDTVDMHTLTEDAIPSILAQLDPHSVYIPASDVERVNEDLEGSFSGIGVQFDIQNDTVMIVAVISGGPSEKLGILPGDRIIEVNDSIFVGSNITYESVLKKLRGKKNTTVKVGIKRSGTPETLHFTIVRGDVPIHSVDVAYMIDERTGYVKISKFSATTYREFLNAITRLRAEGAMQMILDFRGNPGGYMDMAIAMVNEFLPGGRLIVYTKGRTFARDNAFADGTGTSQNVKVAVLIDEWSASASEIFAGAIQDNDRGVIVGRRSFGKGLVQTGIPFPDSSVVRLTVARYYTPSGRSIQKPYTKGKEADYEKDILTRFDHGEFDERDSIKLADTLQFQTIGGRIVHGGGGIMPDVFVPRDTTGFSSYYNKLYSHIYQFAFDYADKNRATLKQYKNWQELEAHLNTQPILEGLINYADSKGVRKNISGLRKSQPLIQNLLNAYIARIMLGNDAFYPIIHQMDSTVIRAVEVLNEEKSLLNLAQKEF